MIDYSKRNKAYRLFDPVTKKYYIYDEMLFYRDIEMLFSTKNP